MAGDFGGDSHPRLFTSLDTREIDPDCVLQVEDQKAFDSLQKSLNSALEKGNKRIEVRFSSGQYVYKTRQILLEKQIRPDVSIRFVGNDCILVPKGQTLRVEQTRETPLDYKYSYLTPDGKDVNLWTPFYQTDLLIQVVNEKEKLCRTYDQPFQGRNRRYYSITDAGRDKITDYLLDFKELMTIYEFIAKEVRKDAE